MGVLVMENVCDCKKKINREDIMKYSFYDDQHNLVLCLDEERIKEIYGVDKIIFQEDYGMQKIS